MQTQIREELTNEQIESIVYKIRNQERELVELVGFVNNREIFAEINFDGSISYYFHTVHSHNI